MHEINNPLQTVAACAEGIAMCIEDMRKAGIDVPEKTEEYTDVIDQEVQRCKRIVDSLLTFSRPKTVEKPSADINAIVEQSLFLVKHHTRFKQLAIRTILDTKKLPVPANAEQLIQVMMALLINAADAMNDKGTVTIRTKRGTSDAEAAIVYGLNNCQMALWIARVLLADPGAPALASY